MTTFLPAGFVPDGNLMAADWWADGDESSSYMGWGTSWAGDTDNDGYDDVIVGAIYYPSGGVYRSGRA